MSWFSRKRDKAQPQLRQFGELTASDFAAHAVWVQCHTMDSDEPWFEETDEETFRPWTGGIPVDPAEGMFLVSARFTLADGTSRTGFVTPLAQGGAEGGPRDLGTIQPIILTAGGQVSFWEGIVVPDEGERASRYAALSAEPGSVFPIRFAAGDGLALGVTAGEIPGFCSIPDFAKVVITT